MDNMEFDLIFKDIYEIIDSGDLHSASDILSSVFVSEGCYPGNKEQFILDFLLKDEKGVIKSTNISIILSRCLTLLLHVDCRGKPNSTNSEKLYKTYDLLLEKGLLTSKTVENLMLTQMMTMAKRLRNFDSRILKLTDIVFENHLMPKGRSNYYIKQIVDGLASSGNYRIILLPFVEKLISFGAINHDNVERILGDFLLDDSRRFGYEEDFEKLSFVLYRFNFEISNFICDGLLKINPAIKKLMDDGFKYIDMVSSGLEYDDILKFAHEYQARIKCDAKFKEKFLKGPKIPYIVENDEEYSEVSFSTLSSMTFFGTHSKEQRAESTKICTKVANGHAAEAKEEKVANRGTHLETGRLSRLEMAKRDLAKNLSLDVGRYK